MAFTVVASVFLFRFRSLFFFFSFRFFLLLLLRPYSSTRHDAGTRPIPNRSVLLRESSQLQTLDVVSEREKEKIVNGAV